MHIFLSYTSRFPFLKSALKHLRALPDVRWITEQFIKGTGGLFIIARSINQDQLTNKLFLTLDNPSSWTMR